jgi:hypothetical protein
MDVYDDCYNEKRCIVRLSNSYAYEVEVSATPYMV